MLFRILTDAVAPFLIFAFIMLLINVLIKGGGKKYYKNKQAFLDAEHSANFARKRDIPDELFCRVNTDMLTWISYPDTTEYSRLNSLLQKAVKKSQNPMMHLDPPKKNIDLKLEFGAVNLEKIIIYEEHYEQYIRALSDLAQELFNLNLKKDAESVLLEAINLRSPIFKPYQLITDIYLSENDKTKLMDIKKRIGNENIISDETLINKVSDYIDGHI
ncbi:MAG: hypothetical protein LBU94_05680 [Clostridiales bacterium]|jgi:hypothetical protein|nr:hypothetical protein [Clostridiales bacterium]